MSKRYVDFVRKGLSIEGAKFLVYLLVPVGFVWYFHDAERLSNLLTRKALIVYPPEDKPTVGSGNVKISHYTVTLDEEGDNKES